MDQSTVYATEIFLRDELAKATLKVTALEDDVANLTKFKEDLITNSNKIHDRYTRLQDAIKSWTREEFRNEDITDKQARELALIGDFTLSQNYDVSVTVEHTFTICVEPGESIDDVLNEIEFSATSYGSELMNDDANVVDTNYDEVDY